MCKHTTVIQLDADRWVCEDCGADAADFIHSSKLSSALEERDVLKAGQAAAQATHERMLAQAADADEQIKALSSRLEGESKNVEAALVQIAEQAKQYNELYTERSNLLYRLDNCGMMMRRLIAKCQHPGLATQAFELMKQYGIEGSILREADHDNNVRCYVKGCPQCDPVVERGSSIVCDGPPCDHAAHGSLKDSTGVIRCKGCGHELGADRCTQEGCNELAVYRSPAVCERHASVIMPMLCSCPPNECRSEHGPHHRCKFQNRV